VLSSRLQMAVLPGTGDEAFTVRFAPLTPFVAASLFSTQELAPRWSIDDIDRPGPLAPLDADGDGEIGALTDGLLILRYLFGFRGAVLASAAVDTARCARCGAAGIEDYLASILALLDVDGDGEVEALTDGVLILRYVFGFRGAALITGAVDTVHCTRCTAGLIETYLGSLLQ
jgi:hypothetical protein